jgi:hypothetical protein
MRYELLATIQTPAPKATRYFAHDLADADKAIEVFAYAHLSLARVTREGWRFLWAHYGLEGLLAINRYAEWFDVNDDEAAAAELVRESLTAGYDPVSGCYGDYSEQSRTFELLACD